ncbi:methionine synthase, vitamin-B12 independent [Hyaloraphidium curvatum]|nr:methionine synthase, vitamin-B12 independent [Hyaloraphidium curvatum]
MSAGGILTTHAGSLPRPQELVDLFAARTAGDAVSPADFEAAVVRAVESVVDRQIEAGVDIGNDGEQGREDFVTYVVGRMDGFSAGKPSPPRMFGDMLKYPDHLQRLMAMVKTQKTTSTIMAPPVVSGPLKYKDQSAINAEIARLKGILQKRKDEGKPVFKDVFMSSPSPGMLAAAMANEHYPDTESYVEALAQALSVEWRAIVDAGFLLQIDAPDLAGERHIKFNGRPTAEFLGFIRIVISAIDRALGHIPRDRVRLHVCYGNYNGPHDLDIPLADIWPEISRLGAGTVLLSLANPRHAHEWRLFESQRPAPGTKLAVGCIDTTTSYIEHPETVADSLERVATALGDPRAVMAATDCGFETVAGISPVVPGVVFAKLKAMREGADAAAKRLGLQA